MTQDEDRIRNLLGRAFGPEPPLGLDRDEIVRRGRRGVRLRRVAASGGVAAAVAAVVLGAAALSNLPGGGSTISPAEASSTTPTSSPTSSPAESAPQGPSLPLTTTTSRKTAVELRAEELTKALAEAKLIPTTFEPRATGSGTRPALVFMVDVKGYRASADLADARGVGNLDIVVDRVGVSTPPVECPQNNPTSTCTIVSDLGLPMSLTTNSSRGAILYQVRVIRPDGTFIYVSASNVATDNNPKVLATRSKPPVEFDVLKKIAALPRLTIG